MTPIVIAGCSARDRAAGASASKGAGAPAATPGDSASAPVLPAPAPQVPALAARPGARATMVNVWATWCAPCREEFPALLQVARAERSHGLRLVLVSADFPDELPAVRKFLAAHGVTDTSYIKSGDDMSFINTLNPKWSGALPATFVYDDRGRLVSYWEGMADEDRFQRSVDRVLSTSTQKEALP